MESNLNRSWSEVDQLFNCSTPAAPKYYWLMYTNMRRTFDGLANLEKRCDMGNASVDHVQGHIHI